MGFWKSTITLQQYYEITFMNFFYSTYNHIKLDRIFINIFSLKERVENENNYNAPTAYNCTNIIRGTANENSIYQWKDLHRK